jgi:hypothetical protein
MYNSDVQRTEPNHTGAPRKVGSVSYSQVSGTSQTYPVISGVLNRQVKARTFIFVNTMNQTTSSINVYLYDSTVGNGNGDTTGIGALGNGMKLTKTSENNTPLASHVDSIAFIVPAFATAPTSGTLDVYVVEVF